MGLEDPCKVVTYGHCNSMDYGAVNIAHNRQGEVSFDFTKGGVFVRRIQLSVSGEHNVSNALAALAAADQLCIPAEVITRHPSAGNSLANARKEWRISSKSLKKSR
mgnify:CR=1 FL=1